MSKILQLALLPYVSLEWESSYINEMSPEHSLKITPFFPSIIFVSLGPLIPDVENT